MQYIIAIVVGESTINIGCLFIVGSDVKGCEVVLVSDHRSINNETVILTRNNTSAYGQLNLKHKASCYHRAIAYSTPIYGPIVFFIDEMLNFDTNIECTGKSMLY